MTKKLLWTAQELLFIYPIIDWRQDYDRPYTEGF